mmetsp:Transcript_379/g.1315  ORF Transcript_379/g.1315 Transcript_379/m.1315 type:complete len:222 (+) Transcript_379:63-728(+)
MDLDVFDVCHEAAKILARNVPLFIAEEGGMHGTVLQLARGKRLCVLDAVLERIGHEHAYAYGTKGCLPFLSIFSNVPLTGKEGEEGVLRNLIGRAPSRLVLQYSHGQLDTAIRYQWSVSIVALLLERQSEGGSSPSLQGSGANMLHVVAWFSNPALGRGLVEAFMPYLTAALLFQESHGAMWPPGLTPAQLALHRYEKETHDDWLLYAATTWQPFTKFAAC